MNKKIAVVTGTRAEYSYLRPLIEKIEKDSELDLLLYVTGMHLLEEYGNTVEEIKKDFEIKEIIDMKEKKNAELINMPLSISEGIKGFAQVFEKDKPEMVVVFGDRIEPFATAIAAISMNIPIAHIHGGDKASADLDNNLRYALTKLSHLHFPATEKSKKRILNLGEEPWRVFNVGSLTLDVILNQELISKEELIKKYSLQDKKILLILNHPTLTEYESSKAQMKSLLKSAMSVAEEKNMQIIIIYPNAYPGGFKIIEEIQKNLNKENLFSFENLPSLDYLSLLKSSSVFVGNSSSGIIEAPSLGTPYVCIGKRQRGRERAKNVIEVNYDGEEISNAIKKALEDKEFLEKVKKCESPYGSGKTSESIIKVLKEIKLDKRLIEKEITY
jgi:GDP/UDP-N,N'-diacetylbacillosamine 2-epimerase (hydrolysing)